jgi:hypothetical protein
MTLPVALVACGLLALPAAGADYVRVVHADTGKVLAVAEDSEEGGAKVVLAKEDKSRGQQWKLEKDGDYYKLVNRKSGMVLDVTGDSKDEGAALIQWEDKSEGFDNQRFAWVGDGKDRRLKAKSSGLVLDIGDEGAVVQKKADEKAKGQLWRVVEVKE